MGFDDVFRIAWSIAERYYPMNPFDALAIFVLGKIKEGLYARWLKFLFELVFSGVVTFLFVCGGVLAGGAVVDSDIGLAVWVAEAIGSGMVMSAIVMTALFRRESNGLTKNMIVVLPSAEATKELATDLQYIEKPGEKK